jgi:SAGA-associated factor 29
VSLSSLAESSLCADRLANLKDRSKLIKDSEVFYRPAKKASKGDQGEGMLCRVKSGSGEGKARRYDLLDVDPEAHHALYTARPQQLVPIPPNNNNEDGTPDPVRGAVVLGLYPTTTTFYRAEFVSSRSSQRGFMTLRFEDEDDKTQEQEVERRYVLADWPGKQP